MDIEQPKVLQNRVDLKSHTIRSISSTINAIREGVVTGISIPNETKLIFVTNYGTIKGDIIDISVKPSELNNENIISYLFAQSIIARNNVIAVLEDETDQLLLTNDSSVIILKKAIVKPFASPESNFSFDDLVLFTDQIVGVTVGT